MSTQSKKLSTFALIKKPIELIKQDIALYETSLHDLKVELTIARRIIGRLKKYFDSSRAPVVELLDILAGKDAVIISIVQYSYATLGPFVKTLAENHVRFNWSIDEAFRITFSDVQLNDHTAIDVTTLDVFRGMRRKRVEYLLKRRNSLIQGVRLRTSNCA